MRTVGERLAEERTRLGFNQSDFSKKANVSRVSQMHYETNNRRPDADYLIAIEAAGADVLYILTGKRTPGIVLNEELMLLKPDETALVDNYRHCQEVYKRNLQETCSAFAQQAKYGKLNAKIA